PCRPAGGDRFARRLPRVRRRKLHDRPDRLCRWRPSLAQLHRAPAREEEGRGKEKGRVRAVYFIPGDLFSLSPRGEGRGPSPRSGGGKGEGQRQIGDKLFSSPI